jgi:hypothetical protein
VIFIAFSDLFTVSWLLATRPPMTETDFNVVLLLEMKDYVNTVGDIFLLSFEQWHKNVASPFANFSLVEHGLEEKSYPGDERSCSNNKL